MSLKAKNLTLYFDETLIFKNLSLELNSGEILGVLGDNGSGKSSLCMCLAGLMPEDTDLTGNIFLDGKNLNSLPVSEKCKNIGVIFQEPETQLFSPTVENELAFAPENLCVPRSEIENRIINALDVCGISHLRHAKTNNLSGGEKQLVAIASVLTQSPKILIADEITSRIDNSGKTKIHNILKNFANNGGAVIMVSHIKSDLKLCTRTINLIKGKNYGN